MKRVRRGYYEVSLEVIARPPYGEDAGPRDRRVVRAASRSDDPRVAAGLAVDPQQVEISEAVGGRRRRPARALAAERVSATSDLR
jgi:hypothetical protein